jgi:hypothetical protein
MYKHVASQVRSRPESSVTATSANIRRPLRILQMMLKSSPYFIRPRVRTSRRGNVLSAFLIWALTPTLPTQAQLKPQTEQLFQRLFASQEFEPGAFGPARWLEDGRPIRPSKHRRLSHTPRTLCVTRL